MDLARAVVRCHVATMRISTALLAIIALLTLAGCQNGFSPADIEKIKENIRFEYNKSGEYEVLEIAMVRETPTKLNGFVKLKHKLFGDITKSCDATMAEDGHNIIWQCGAR